MTSSLARAWWSIFTVLGLAGLALLIGIILRLRKFRRPPLVIHLSQPIITRLEHRHDLVIETNADFANVSKSALSITAIHAGISVTDRHYKEARRILGDNRTAHRQHGHPPDLALRLPIAVPSAATVSFVFQFLFEPDAKTMLSNGLLRVQARTADGDLIEALRTLAPPAANS